MAQGRWMGCRVDAHMGCRVGKASSSCVGEAVLGACEGADLLFQALDFLLQLPDLPHTHFLLMWASCGTPSSTMCMARVIQGDHCQAYAARRCQTYVVTCVQHMP